MCTLFRLLVFWIAAIAILRGAIFLMLLLLDHTEEWLKSL